MGQRKARLAYAIREGKPVPPPVAPEMFDEETILLSKVASKLVTEEFDASPYQKNMTRSKYLALLVESAANHERKLREEREGESSLVKLAPLMPPAAVLANIMGGGHGRR